MATMQSVFDAYQARTTAHEKRSSKNRYANGIAWLDGEITPLHQARIPLLDQGFLRSDLTYDVASVWDGRFFRLADHLTRITESWAKLRMKLPLGTPALRQTLLALVVRSGIRDAYVQITVTRGLLPVRGSKVAELENKLYLFVRPYVWVMDPATQLSGTGRAIIARSVRRYPPASFDPTIKNLQWGDFTKGMIEAQERTGSGAVHPFLLDGEGNLTEGSGFNVVLVKDGVLYTPIRGVLEGVTRKSVFDVAAKLGVEARMQIVKVDLAYEADEIFMCTTAGGIMPITELDGKPVGNGEVGPVTARIWDGYWGAHYDPRFSFEVDYDVVEGGERARL